MTKGQGKGGIIFQEEGATFQTFRVRQKTKKPVMLEGAECRRNRRVRLGLDQVGHYRPW